jgi:hypothetical protein
MSLSSVAVPKSADDSGSGLHAKGAHYCPGSKEPGYGNGFLSSKSDMDYKIYKALVECIHYHQQLLL